MTGVFQRKIELPGGKVFAEGSEKGSFGKTSRRDRRKAERRENKAKKHEAWLQHQRFEASKKSGSNKPKNHFIHNLTSRQDSQLNVKDKSTEKSKKIKVKSKSSNDNSSCATEVNGKRCSGKLEKTKFEEYLEMCTPNAAFSAEEDLELERKLAKKLKVKNGNLRGVDDGINMLFEGIPIESLEKSLSGKKHKKRKSSIEDVKGEIALSDAVLEPLEPHNTDAASEELDEALSKKKGKKRKLSERGKGGLVDAANASTLKSEESRGKSVANNLHNPSEIEGNKKYVAPHLRSHGRIGSEDYAEFRRRIRGLLNRLSESNIESVTKQISHFVPSDTASRTAASQLIIEEVLASCSAGPRGNEQYAAVFAAFVAAMACDVGTEFGVNLIASLAKNFEDEYHKEDNLSLRNLTLLLSYLCLFGVCYSDLIFDFLSVLSKRLTEIDVSTILTVLQSCGMKLRGDDPSAMKDFIISVQNRVNELKASCGDGLTDINSKRMEFMLETICDIKNNKKRPKESPAQHAQINKWLHELRVEDISIRGLKWSKLIDPENQWVSSGDVASMSNNVEEVATTINKEIPETQILLHRAAALSMNTDARKAIFCIIMSGDDYVDAFEKLLRLDLPGKQDREIMRVLVQCCIHEKVFNKYYTILASKLCEHDKNHKFTLQFCIWDRLKELESMELIKSMNLAKFIAEMVASFTLSLAVLKTVELSDVTLLPKRIMHFRIMFEALFERPESLMWNMFTRVAVTPELETLRSGMEFFIREYVVKNNKGFAEKYKIVRKALNNVEGVLM